MSEPGTHRPRSLHPGEGLHSPAAPCRWAPRAGVALLGIAWHCEHLPGPPRAGTALLCIAWHHQHRPLLPTLPLHRTVSPRPFQPCPVSPCFVLHACSRTASRCALLPGPIRRCPVLPRPSRTELPAVVLPALGCPAQPGAFLPGPTDLASPCVFLVLFYIALLSVGLHRAVLCCQVLRSLTWNCFALCCQAPIWSSAVPCCLSKSRIALCCLLLRYIPSPTLLLPCCTPGCCAASRCPLGGLHCRAPYCIMLSSGFALHHPALPDLELHSSASRCLAPCCWPCCRLAW